MSKRFLMFVAVSAFFLFMVGCSQTEFQEMSETEILELLSQVVTGEDALEKAGQQYFLGLSNENNNISVPSALHERLTNTEPVTVLDIRRAEDFARGHIEGAVNIWWFDVGHHLDELPRDRSLLVTCYNGQAAGQVVGVLRMIGFEAVSLAGGMNGGWLSAGLPVVTE